MKKQLSTRILALVLAFAMTMSLAATAALAADVTDDDGIEVVDCTTSDDLTEEAAEDVIEETEVTEEAEEVAEEATKEEAEEEIAQPEEEEASAETEAVEEELTSVPEVAEIVPGWNLVDVDGETVPQFYYMNGNELILARDHYAPVPEEPEDGAEEGEEQSLEEESEDPLVNHDFNTAFYLPKGTVTDAEENTISFEGGFYYFDAEGVPTKVTTWGIYDVTAIAVKNGVYTADKTIKASELNGKPAASGVKCFKFDVAHTPASGMTCYKATPVTAIAPVRAANGKGYLAKVEGSTIFGLTDTLPAGNSGLYPSKSLLRWDANDKVTGWEFKAANKDAYGYVGALMTGVYKTTLGSPYQKQGAQKESAWYYFQDGKPVNYDNKFVAFYNTELKKYYGLYYTDAATNGGYSKAQYAAAGSVTNFGGKVTGKEKVFSISSKGIASPHTGVFNLYYYKAGIKTKYNGWLKVKTTYKDDTAANIQKLAKAYRGIAVAKYAYDYYYFNNSSKCVTGKKQAPSINSSEDKRKYYFYFDAKTGKLIQNLFTYNKAYLSQKMYIYVDDAHANHQATFLLYNSSTKKYDIAALQSIATTPKRSVQNGKDGLKQSKYWLGKKDTMSWANNEAKSKSHKATAWFSNLTFLRGYYSNTRTGFFFHSPGYRTKGDFNTLMAQYNNIGSSTTAGCLRLQTGMCEIVQKISHAQKKNKQVLVLFGKYPNISPFMRITRPMIQVNQTDKKKANYITSDPTRKMKFN